MSQAELRRALAGYSPIPLNGERPAPTSWQQKITTNADEIVQWDRVFPDAGNTGVVMKFPPTFDIGILDFEAAQAVEELVRERFDERGYILVRVGAAPKRAILFCTDTPFPKITHSIVAPNGDGAQKLELLSDGQQVVVHGIHPSTGKPYAWHRGEPGKIKAGELPYINATEALALVDDAGQLLVAKFGARK